MRNGVPCGTRLGLPRGYGYDAGKGHVPEENNSETYAKHKLSYLLPSGSQGQSARLVAKSLDEMQDGAGSGTLQTIVCLKTAK